MTKENRPPIEFTGPSLCGMSAREVIDLLRRGEVSPSELIEACESRIGSVDGSVNAMVTRCYDRARSRLSDSRRGEGEAGWLCGLPVAIKDLSAVSGVRLTMGTVGMSDFVPNNSDPIVEIIESRGGLVIGKTNTPEMGAGANTFNDVFGMTRNPWDTTKNAGGSSGGAAVSLATGEVWLAQGSDLAGSLRTPAAYCGVVGFRPSPGVAFGGPYHLGFSGEALSGPMARDVLDCALFLDSMSGYDSRAPLGLPSPPESYLTTVERSSPRIRIAYAPDLGGFGVVESEIESIMSSALGCLERDGATIESACPPLDNLYETYVTLRSLVWLALAGRAPASVQSGYKESLRQNIEHGRNLSVDDITDAALNRTVLYHSARKFFEDYDVLGCAVVGLEPNFVVEEYPSSVGGIPMSDYIDWLRFSFLATTVGLPSVSVPCGFTLSGMPVGIQLIGGPRCDAQLLGVAYCLERSLNLGISLLDPIVRH